MLLERQRAEIVHFGMKLAAAKLTTGTGGNLSILEQESGRVAISPSGVDYDAVKPGDVVVLDLDGSVVDGDLIPSSEWRFHLALYRHRRDIRAVVHTHSVFATTLACLHWEIPAVHYLVAFCGKKVPLASYAAFGTDALSRNIIAAIENYNAVLMANHGLTAIGKDLQTAFTIAQEIELVAEIYYRSRCAGSPILLSGAEMDRVVSRFETYGQQK